MKLILFGMLVILFAILLRVVAIGNYLGVLHAPLSPLWVGVGIAGLAFGVAGLVKDINSQK